MKRGQIRAIRNAITELDLVEKKVETVRDELVLALSLEEKPNEKRRKKTDNKP